MRKLCIFGIITSLVGIALDTIYFISETESYSAIPKTSINLSNTNSTTASPAITTMDIPNFLFPTLIIMFFIWLLVYSCYKLEKYNRKRMYKS